MQVSVARAVDLSAAQLDLWRQMVTAGEHLSSPFLAPEYVLALANGKADPRVGVIEDGPEIVGFFPFEVRGEARGVAPGTRMTDATGVVHRPGFGWDARELIAACGLRYWEMTDLIEEQIPPTARFVVREGSPVIDFAAGYHAYLDELRSRSKQTVQSIQRKQRKLAREVGELRFEVACSDRTVLRTLLRWKSDQYRATGEWDRFADPTNTALAHALLDTDGPTCAGTLSVLWAGDRPAAAHLGVRSSSTLAWWIPAYDPELARYSPGLQLLLMTVEAAADAGLRRVNLGSGQQSYKDAMKTGELVVARGLLDDGSPPAVLRRLRRAPRHFLRPLLAGHPRLSGAARRLAGAATRN